MRKESEVLQRYRELRLKRLAKMKRQRLSVAPLNCQHNEIQKINGKGKIGFCQNPEVLEKVGRVALACNDNGQAEKCPFYRCRHTTHSVDADFDQVLRSPARCGEEYPKLAMLIWFLQGAQVGSRPIGLVGRTRRVFRAVWRFLVGDRQ